MPGDIKLIILDFDGTIGDTRSLIVRTMRQTVVELGLPQHTDEEYASRIGLPLRQTFTTLIEMDEATADLCETTYRRLFSSNDGPGAVTAFPNVVDTVKELHRRGCLLTIATSRGRASVIDFLQRLKIDEYIGYVLGGDDVTNAKPDPEPVFKTLKDNNLAAANTVVVGDTAFDILMAHRAGVRAVGVSYGNGTIDELTSAGADFIIDDFAGLLSIF